MERSGVFISYASEDIEHAQRLYEDLKNAGLEPWLDKINLLAGQRWQPAIREAILTSRYFIALISDASTKKTGYVQSEFRQALEILNEFPESEIYVIPVRLEDSTPDHQKLNEIQRVDLFPDWNTGLEGIIQSMSPNENDSDVIGEATNEAETAFSLEPSDFVSVKVDFSIGEQPPSELRGRAFAVITEWVEFDHIKENSMNNTLEFPAGNFRTGYAGTSITLQPKLFHQLMNSSRSSGSTIGILSSP